ncbi:tetratricopeptide repeat protein [Variovorax saccharolyticus]|uniref:tetratricopeptide repeat protein n=1 Tax=Variovorax saccharolyticus TaxID=3053516 RepID=UPI0025755E1E|nr:tetratricopeptide repeat protein [Variovorax sp. J22R187]MDM0020650.1 tetratricopeptide repeat protein [Variovorax sp. J22R187]
MNLALRRSRLAAAAFLALIALAAQGQTEAPAPASPTSPAPIINPSPPPGAPAVSETSKASAQAQPSAMTAELFYEVLLGELNARSDPGAAYGLVLDAARRARDGKLFQRAVEIALQSRSGDSALAAARAWKDTLPDSREARRFELQILIALNRIAETVEPLRAELAATPQVERPFLMAVIARNYARATDKKLAASVVEQALADELASPATGGAAWATVGRLRLAAGDTSGALEAAIKGQQLDPSSEGPALLALDIMDPAQPLAEPIVKRYLAGPKAQPEMRVGYARALVEGRRYAEASAELTTLTAARPELPEPWLLLGSLQTQARQDKAAEASINRFISLAPTLRDPEGRERGLTQAYLLMAQLAERRKDFAGAETWLGRIDSTDDLVGAQARRAALLARQGKLAQARELVRSLPERTADEKKQKFLTEVQLLRDAKQYQSAFDMLAQASAAAPTDTDLIYDQAMVAEKLNRLDEMERLLRRVIELKPDNQNAYNALGYSLADRKVRLEEARSLIQKAVQLAPEDPFIADSLGWVEYRLGNTAEALRILEDAYKRRPDPEIGAHLGEVLWAAGQRDRAVTIWKEASLADADNETLQETLKRLHVKL